MNANLHHNMDLLVNSQHDASSAHGRKNTDVSRNPTDPSFFIPDPKISWDLGDVSQ